jgi:four helix bundle protein
METKQKQKPGQDEISQKEILFRESFVFVLDIIQFTELLEKKKKNSLAKQLLTAGTLFGKIINEARYTENSDVFIGKIKKLIKAAHNIKYLLQLCKYSEGYPNPRDLLKNIDILIVKISDI